MMCASRTRYFSCAQPRVFNLNTPFLNLPKSESSGWFRYLHSSPSIVPSGFHPSSRPVGAAIDHSPQIFFRCKFVSGEPNVSAAADNNLLETVRVRSADSKIGAFGSPKFTRLATVRKCLAGRAPLEIDAFRLIGADRAVDERLDQPSHQS